jgi:hypothetical protein
MCFPLKMKLENSIWQQIEQQSWGQYLWRSAEEIGNKYSPWDIQITQFFHRLAVLWSLHSSSDGFSLVRNRLLWTDISICCFDFTALFSCCNGILILVVRLRFCWPEMSEYRYLHSLAWHPVAQSWFIPALGPVYRPKPGINSGTNTGPYQAGMTLDNTSRIPVPTW